MDYTDFYNATKNFLLNQQQLKIIFEPRKQSEPILPFLPYIALGGKLMTPMRALSKKMGEEIGRQLGVIKFGKEEFILEPFQGGIHIAQKHLPRIYEEKLTKENYLTDITLHFDKGEIWIGYTIYDFDEITRDIDRHIRYYIDDVPEIRKIVVFIFHQLLEKP